MAQTDSLQRVRDSFALQGAMSTLGAQLTHLAPGAVDISFDHRLPIERLRLPRHTGG